jgi:hypothetical protein
MRTYPAFTPSPLPLLTGWFLLAYSLSLLVWPARWLPSRAETRGRKPNSRSTLERVETGYGGVEDERQH